MGQRTRSKPSSSSSSKKKKKAGLKTKSKQLLILFGIGIILILYIGGLWAQASSKGISLDNGWTYTKAEIDYSPLQCIYVAVTTSDGLQYTMYVAAIAAAILIVIKLLGVGKKDLHDERGFNKSAKGTYGTSGWMDKEDIPKNFDVKPIEETNGTILGMFNTDEVISLPLNSRLNKHTAIYGASGTGKSRCFVRGQVMQCVTRGESIIITDPKGELYADTAQYMKNNGYNVKVFDLVDPKYSDSWNCLQEVMTDPDQTELLAQTFADIIIKNTSEGKGDHFWDNAEMSLLKALILYVVLDETRSNESKNIGVVYELLTNSSEEELANNFKKLKNNHPALKPWGIFQKASESVRGNVIIGLGSRLQVFQSPDIMRITQFNEIDIEAPAREKCGYFVIMSDQNSTLDFLSSLFFSFLFIRTVKYADVHGKDGKCDVPVNFILDEFPNIGQIPDFTKKLSTIRSRDLRVCVIFQNVAQLQNRYPDGLWEEIIGNCDTQLFLGCTDQMTAKFISERTGEMTIEVNSQGVKKETMAIAQAIPSYSETTSVGKRAVLTPDEVLRVPNENCLIILRGQKVLKAKKYDYSNHPTAKQFIYTPIRDHKPAWKLALEQQTKDAQRISDTIKNGTNPDLQEVDIDNDEDDMLPGSSKTLNTASLSVPKQVQSTNKQPLNSSSQANNTSGQKTAQNNINSNNPTTVAASSDTPPQSNIENNNQQLEKKKQPAKPYTIDNPNESGSARPYNAAAIKKSSQLTPQQQIQAEINRENKRRSLYPGSTAIAISEGSNKSSTAPLDF